jgi:hypothetical protein
LNLPRAIRSTSLWSFINSSLQSYSWNTLLSSDATSDSSPQALSSTMQHSRNSLPCIPLSELASTIVDRIPLLLEQLQNLEAEEAFLDTKILLLQKLHRRSTSISMNATKAQPGTSVAENTLKKRHVTSDGMCHLKRVYLFRLYEKNRDPEKGYVRDRDRFFFTHCVSPPQAGGDNLDTLTRSR